MLMSDPIDIELFANRLESIVVEMGVTVVQTAHSSIFTDSRDYSVALLTPQGEILAMGQYIPHHQGAAMDAFQAVIAHHPIGAWHEGDVYLINDPYGGGNHTADFSLFAPAYLRGEIVLVAACVAHHVDTGGMRPGGYAPDATEIFQEGIRFPGVQLVAAGEILTDILRIFTTNVRLPDQQRGDLLGQVAALHVGVTRAQLYVESLGQARLEDLSESLLTLTERRVRAEITELPDGRYRAEDAIEHDGITDRIFQLKAELTIQGDRAVVDFSASDDQAAGLINSSWSNTKANVVASFMLFFEGIPRNAGFFRAVEVRAREGCFFRPRHPAPVGATTTEGGGRVFDLVLQALSLCRPERGVGTWTMAWIGACVDGKRPDGDRFVHWFIDGMGTGGGARANCDGWNSSNIGASNCLMPNVEVQELASPVRFVSRSLITDSGGAGEFRGGLGIENDIELLADCTAWVLASRTRVPPPGFAGGLPGGLAEVKVIRASGEVEQIPAKMIGLQLRAGDRLVRRCPGGGGYGPPLARARDAVVRDLAESYISSDAAEDIYGYRA
jgi:N-methylhydantoinase B/oxoprolinase/acetone carboxylase alpha subunit